MSIVRSETQEYQTQLLVTLKGSWCIIETSSGYVMGRVVTLDLRNLNILLSPGEVLIERSRLAFRAVLIRGSDIKKVLICEDESVCKSKFDHIKKLLDYQ